MNANRFVNTWTQAGGSAVRARHIYSQVFEHYAEPGRHYHTPQHITHCLNKLDTIAHLFEDRWSAELAIWFHDVIYVIGGKDNERQSARFFLECSREQLNNGRRRRVSRHILATIHPSDPSDPDSRLLVDVDLSSFALPWPQFLRDSANVRREAASQCAALEYAQRQHRFLASLHESPHFFLTEHFRKHHEPQARENITKLMALLSARQAGGDSPPVRTH